MTKEQLIESYKDWILRREGCLKSTKLEDVLADMLREYDGIKENAPDKIFEGARFGDRFKTRDGSMAVFAYRDEAANVCIIENLDSFWAFTDFGQCITTDRGLDIVSRWEEEP